MKVIIMANQFRWTGHVQLDGSRVPKIGLLQSTFRRSQKPRWPAQAIQGPPESLPQRLQLTSDTRAYVAKDMSSQRSTRHSEVANFAKARVDH